ncbi:MAG: 2Fe-2S iron-sulfur cluster-binding protein [Betaproteobacteria bacterium]
MAYELRIEGHDAIAVSAEPGDTILEALLMAGVAFAYSCQTGNCGTCKCELVSGDVLELEYSEHALTRGESARGMVLACRCQIWSDTAIRRLDPEDFDSHPSRLLQCVVLSISAVTRGVSRLRLNVVSGGEFFFSAGQYAALEFDSAPGIRRHYSMANRPGESILEFHVARNEVGMVDDRLVSVLKPGDGVRVAGPFGTSYLRRSHEGPVIAVAEGSGFAQIRSILSTLRLTGGRQPVHLYLVGRVLEDVYGMGESVEWMEGYPGSSTHIVLSEVEPGSVDTVRNGRVPEVLSQDFDGLSGYKAYVAGSAGMVSASCDVLAEKGLRRLDIHAQEFDETATSEGEAGAEVLMRRLAHER